MKVKVLQDFRDKYDKNKHYKIGDEIEITKKRYKEILEVGQLVEEVKEGEQKNGK